MKTGKAKTGIGAIAFVGVAAVAALAATSSAEASTHFPRLTENTVKEDTEGVLLTDGVLVRSERSGVYKIEDGKKRPFTDPSVLRSQGYEFDEVKFIKHSELTSIPTGNIMPFEDGTLVSAPGQNEVYIIENGTRRHIVSPGVLHLSPYSFDQIVEAPWGTINAHPRVADYTNPEEVVDGSYIYAGNSGVYRVEDGVKRPIPDPATLMTHIGSWDHVREVSGQKLAEYSTGVNILPDEGSVVADSESLYLVTNGQKRAFESMRDFRDLGYSTSEIKDVSEWIVNATPQGKDIGVSRMVR